VRPKNFAVPMPINTIPINMMKIDHLMDLRSSNTDLKNIINAEMQKTTPIAHRTQGLSRFIKANII